MQVSSILSWVLSDCVLDPGPYQLDGLKFRVVGRRVEQVVPMCCGYLLGLVNGGHSVCPSTLHELRNNVGGLIRMPCMYS